MWNAHEALNLGRIATNSFTNPNIAHSLKKQKWLYLRAYAMCVLLWLGMSYNAPTTQPLENAADSQPKEPKQIYQTINTNKPKYMNSCSLRSNPRLGQERKNRPNNGKNRRNNNQNPIQDPLRPRNLFPKDPEMEK